MCDRCGDMSEFPYRDLMEDFDEQAALQEFRDEQEAREGGYYVHRGRRADDDGIPIPYFIDAFERGLYE